MSILQDLLNLGLVDIGSDDSRFAKMETAAVAFGDRLKGDPVLVIPAALIAIDADADEDDPVFGMVEDHVIEQWKTMRNTHQNRPRELLRSIIIQALSTISDRNPEMAALIWHTTIGPINHGQARLGKEADILTRLLRELGKQAEEEAVVRARLVAPPPKKRRSKKDSSTPVEFSVKPSAPLKDAEILADVARSAGPQQPSGEAMASPNPHWPNQGQAWSNDFSPRMTAALVKAVNLGTERVFAQLGESLQSYANDIEQRLTSQMRRVEAVRVEMLEAQQAAQIRLDVLWWAEARYSPSLMCGYWEMPQAAAAVAMAHDLTQIVPPMVPASVTYVLGEAVAASLRLETNPVPLPVEALLRDLRANGSKLRDVLPNITTNDVRVPLFELTAEAAGGSEVTAEDLRRKAGVDPTLELSLPAFAMWTFRDIQARRLAEGLK